MKKPTLKEEFNAFYIKYPAINGCLPDMDAIWQFFEPNLKKTKTKEKLTIDIPKDKLEEFNQLWPASKLPTGQYGRSSDRELHSAFTSFFKEFPTFTDWNILLKSAEVYLAEREQEQWQFTRRSKYFVRRTAKDNSMEFLLAEYYQRIRDGVQDEPEQRPSFEPKVY